jgi:hypothetical protein
LSFCAEDRLLLAAAGAPFRPDGAERVRELLGPGLDWDYVLETSIRHAISPLVHAALEQATGPDELAALIPGAVRDELSALHDMTGARSRRLYAALTQIARSFARAGVDALALKEIPLALHAFPDLAQRPIGDLDLLIRADNYNRAVAALGALGYEPVPQPELPFTRKYACAHHLRRAEDEVWVDLQWNLAEREFDIYGEGNFTFDPETMWEGASPLVLGREAVFAAPRPEPMLFHLCLHAEGHGYGELVLFTDIAALLYRETIDWGALRDLARSYDAEASVYYALLFAQRLLGASVPERALQELEPAYVDGPMANAVFGNLTQLHLALDDVRAHARPPAKVVAAMEEVVREQAVGAMNLAREVDHVLRAFKQRGGSVVVVTGAPSERMYPDATLAAFGLITVVILADDLRHLVDGLAERGFETQLAGEEHRLFKRVAIESRDPVLRDHVVELDIEWTLAREWQRGDVLEETSRRSKKDTALALVRSRGHAGDDQRPLRARVKVLALEVEDGLAYLAARLGARENGRLFALWTVAELFRAAPHKLGALDPEAFRTKVAHSGFVTEVCDGLAIAEELLEDKVAAASAALACAPRQPRVLEWARYGPESLIRRSGFKRAFFVLYSLKSLRSRRERAAYLRRVLTGGRSHPPFAHSLLVELARGGVAALTASAAGSRDLAVWIEPPELRRLATESDVQEDDERKDADGHSGDLVSGNGEQRDDAAQHDEHEQDLH